MVEAVEGGNTLGNVAHCLGSDLFLLTPTDQAVRAELGLECLGLLKTCSDLLQYWSVCPVDQYPQLLQALQVVGDGFESAPKKPGRFVETQLWPPLKRTT